MVELVSSNWMMWVYKKDYQDDQHLFLYYFRSYSAKRQKSWNASLLWHLQQKRCQETTKRYRTGQTNTIQRIPNKSLACTCENLIFSNTNWKVLRYVRPFLFNYMFGIYLPGAVEYGYESFGISKRFIVVTGIFESAIWAKNLNAIFVNESHDWNLRIFS